MDEAEKPNKINFLEERDASLLRMTLNAYKNLHTAYVRMKQTQPNLSNEVEYFSRTVSPIEKQRRRAERISFASNLGYQFGASRRDPEGRFDHLDDELKREIFSGLEKGESDPREFLNPYSSKLLFLRANAFAKGRFCDLDMSPDDLKRITPDYCPILGTRLSIHTGNEIHQDERHQWSVERMCNSLGYAKDNIAVISTAANAARSNLNAEQILERAAGVVIDNQLTQIQWCRLLNHHYSSLRLENPYLRQLDPPVTWTAPRYSKVDMRFIAHSISNPHAGSRYRIDATADMLSEYFKLAGKSSDDSVRAAKAFKKECSVLSRVTEVETEVNLIYITAQTSNKQMINQLAKDVYGSDYLEKRDLGEADRRLISKASSAGCSTRWGI